MFERSGKTYSLAYYLVCPYCRHVYQNTRDEAPTIITAESHLLPGMLVKCKNRHCGRVFKVPDEIGRMSGQLQRPGMLAISYQ